MLPSPLSAAARVKGTFVPDHGPDRTLFHSFHVVREGGRREHPITLLVDLREGLSCLDWAALQLGIVPASPTLFARNLQHLQGEPVMLDELWLSQALFLTLDRAGFVGRNGTVYGLYQRRFGLSVVRTEESLRDDVAVLLRLAARTPVLHIRRVAYAIGDRAVEARQSRANTQHHEYRMSRG